MGNVFRILAGNNLELENHFRGIYRIKKTDKISLRNKEKINEYTIKSASISEFMIFFTDLIGQDTLRTIILRVINNYMIRCGGFIEEKLLVIRTKHITCVFNILENEGCNRAVILEIE
jgi:hypothetical protein